jgi:hypothetical protein
VRAAGPIIEKLFEVLELLGGKARFHQFRIEFNAEELEQGGWAVSFGWLEMEAELFSERERPFERFLDLGKRHVGCENLQKVVEVMPYEGRQVVLQDPMQSLRKEVEDVWSRSATKTEDDVVVEFFFPCEAEQMSVRRSHRDMAESGLEVEFDEETAAAGLYDVGDCAVNHVVLDGSFGVGDAIIHGPAAGPREMVDAPDLGGSFASYRAQR